MADSFTPNYNFVIQQPGTNRNTWGTKLNSNWTAIDGLLFTATTDAASALALGQAALPRSGGTMTGPVTLPTTGGAVNSAGFRGAPPVALGTTRTLSAADNAILLILNSGNSTVTLPASMAVGSVFPIKNRGSGTITLSRASGVTLTVDGSNTNKNCTIGPYGKGVLTVNATNEWSVSGASVS